MRLRLTLAAGLLASTPAIAAEPPPRQPTGKWNVDFGAAQCVAVRPYGTSEDPLYLVLKSPPLGNVMQVAVMRKGGFEPAGQVDATIIADQRPPRKTSMLMFGTTGTKLRTYTLNMPLADFQEVRAAKTLAIQSPGLRETFSLSQMTPMLSTMDQCVTDLRKVWNVGDTTGETSQLGARAQANLASYVKSDDYPGVAAMQDQSGRVSFALLVDEQGKVADCTVIETSGVPALDAQSCAVIRKRAKFKPAVGADGKPAKDAVIGRIRWVMPD